MLELTNDQLSNTLSRVILQLCTYFFDLSANAYLKLGANGTHSDQSLVQQNKMKVKILPALSDNYMYLVSTMSKNFYSHISQVTPLETDTLSIP